MASCCRNYSEVGPVDFVGLVHLETIIAYTINIITFASVFLFCHPGGPRGSAKASAAVEDICKSFGMPKGESKKIKVMIEALLRLGFTN